jgi:beta-glucosidase
MAEMFDAPDLSLPDGQDLLIEAIASANSRTIVVLETGGPVRMPWLTLTAAVIEAWYPGARGGEAVARVLFGEINPSGRLPMTFPADEAQLPRAKMTNEAENKDAGRQAAEVNYVEGARVGYKWFDQNGLKPLFRFGYGLSYTAFDYAGLTANRSESSITVSVDVKNTGSRRGAGVPQFYLRRPDDADFPVRLAAWSKVLLAPGETQRVTLTVDPRLLARFDETAGLWEIAPGRYAIEAGDDAGELPLRTEVTLPLSRFRPDRREPG